MCSSRQRINEVDENDGRVTTGPLTPEFIHMFIVLDIFRLRGCYSSFFFKARLMCKLIILLHKCTNIQCHDSIIIIFINIYILYFWTLHMY